MIFTVTYRDQTGAKREEAIEADSREAAFAALKSRGISPLSILEGGRAGRVPMPGGSAACSHAAESRRADNGRAGAPRPPQSRTGKMRIGADSDGAGRHPYRAARRLSAVLGILALLAILGGGAWWWLMRSPETATLPPDSPPKTAAGEAKPSHRAIESVTNEARTGNAGDSRVETATSPASAAGDPYNGVWRGKKIISYTITTNGWSTYERIVTEDGRSHGVIGTTVKPLFDNGSDQMLALAVRSPKDSTLPPMPISPTLNEDFLESLKKPIKIDENDSEEVKQLKRDVIQAREDMLGLMDKGMTVQEALTEHFKMANENAGIRSKAVEELRAMIESGDAEGAEKYVDAVNGTLEKLGIMRLELPEADRRRRKGKSNNQDERNAP